MHVQSTGRDNPGRFQVNWINFKERLRRFMVDKIDLTDGEHTYAYESESIYEFYRPMTLLIKEEGTMDWIKREVKRGDVFYDIGANIGIYTLAAGKRVGGEGQVYAFEPHAGSFQRLLKNISLNKLGPTVKAISAALNSEEGFFDFNYCEWAHGSTASQLGTKFNEFGEEFTPVCSEYKYSTTIDALLERKALRPATLIKIDVDGNEPRILRGMAKFLGSPQRPRSVQIEMNIRVKDEIYGLMTQYGYHEILKHFTHSGKQRIAAGADPAGIPYNAVFAPVEG